MPPKVDVEDNVGGWDIIKAMLGYVWPKGDLGIKSRVVVALSLLISAKVRIEGSCSRRLEFIIR